MAIELVVGGKIGRWTEKRGDHPEIYGPSQEGQEVQAGREYKRKSQIQDYGPIV